MTDKVSSQQARQTSKAEQTAPDRPSLADWLGQQTKSDWRCLTAPDVSLASDLPSLTASEQTPAADSQTPDSASRAGQADYVNRDYPAWSMVNTSYEKLGARATLGQP